MKECKIVLYPNTIKKCEELGIKKSPQFGMGNSGERNYLFIRVNGSNAIYIDKCHYDFINEDIPEVSNEEFLKWVKPLRKGDIVSCLNNRIVEIFMINNIGRNDIGRLVADSGELMHGGYDLSLCKLLTNEELTILGYSVEDFIYKGGK